MSSYRDLAMSPGALGPLEALMGKAQEELLHDMAAIVAYDRLQALLPEIEADAEALAATAAEATEARDKLAARYEAERVAIVQLRADLGKLPASARHSEEARALADKIRQAEHDRQETGAKLTTQKNIAAGAAFELKQTRQALERLRGVELPELPTLAILRRAIGG